MTTLAHIRKYNDQTPFVPEWGKLTKQDKEDLHQWAREEMTALGIEITEKS